MGIEAYLLIVIRVVEPEILDDIDPSDPDAVRSRRDLRMINRLMGGPAWIIKKVCGLGDVQRVVELGAGDGLMCNRMKVALPDCQVTAVDFITKPSSVRDDIDWQQANVLDYDGYDRDTIVVANLFIHHLEALELKRMGEKLRHVRAIVFAEPHRKPSSVFMGRILFPVVNHVTRHDMMTSIRAGFVSGEMIGLLDSGHRWSEEVGLLGGIRVMGVKS